jgi:hypothetical protein
MSNAGLSGSVICLTFLMTRKVQRSLQTKDNIKGMNDALVDDTSENDPSVDFFPMDIRRTGHVVGGVIMYRCRVRVATNRSGLNLWCLVGLTFSLG